MKRYVQGVRVLVKRFTENFHWNSAKSFKQVGKTNRLVKQIVRLNKSLGKSPGLTIGNETAGSVLTVSSNDSNRPSR